MTPDPLAGPPHPAIAAAGVVTGAVLLGLGSLRLRLWPTVTATGQGTDSGVAHTDLP